MTNERILQSDILDILFENRNKEYGAYALRRGYNHRLFIAIGIAMAVLLLFIFTSMVIGKNEPPAPITRYERIVEIKEIKLEKPKTPEKPKELTKTVQKVATQKFVSRIEIKPDNKVKEVLPDIKSLDSSLIADKTVKGKVDDGIPKKTEQPVVIGNSNTSTTEPEKEFKPQEKEPEFPGGSDALKRFLAGNLQTPGDLEDGEKKVVKIRFKVDKDGSVNTFEIITSGGNEYDREVVRVCKKMPRWTPALQNGINVPVSYVLPVTFIGVEQ
ncbi:MAG TPA: TonB family protein [Chitinophagaceae bacterium]|nr:TonB family protein [Chitinophagaceae bacterium]